ncbi:MAG TPA: NGG1p interacting factor NIF3, partial [Cellvibrionaceae bacterium]|nr:NGG1p interacting factor NIF3 [Cellvibrionaceae bacterium]
TGAKPQIGAVGELVSVPEYRVEVLCSGRNAAAVEAALLKAHPYEAPAYDFTLLWRPTPQ